MWPRALARVEVLARRARAHARFVKSVARHVGDDRSLVCVQPRCRVARLHHDHLLERAGTRSAKIRSSS
ncbi:MAG: hypothetical protein QOE90_3031 [Thermoplasmata archaeon]|jgi:hypothetical protein|nr:hypothetical protein [Thermoplasmata archaeon]